ncbi:MAG TPA: heparan-alpha-glucosaminide N-acetyltransferase domain-containing protein, partial [Anaeromyxobacter sp.]
AEKTRKLWLDWQRGLAVLYMVEWHTYDSWRADAVARGGAHDVLATIGGFAAPSFLYMAGMSQLLADAAAERKQIPAPERRARAVRRALWLLGVAYVFRLAEYLLGGAYRMPGGWRSILRVDVLNVIAVSLLAAALLTVGRRPRTQVALAAGAACAVAFLAPVAGGWEHSPSRILDYLYTADWQRGIFHLFPWAAFALAGVAFGRLAWKDPRPLLWIGMGAALFAGGWLAERLLPPFYAHQDFWRTSPQWLAMRLGLVVATSGALQLLPASADRWLSWLRTMGRHSLLGYFISIELPYGALSSDLHKRLGMGAALLGVVAMTAATWAASAAADRYDAWKAERARRAVPPAATPTA